MMLTSALRNAASGLALSLALAASGAAQAQVQAPSTREVLKPGVEPLAYALSIQPDAAKLAFTGQARIEFEVSAPTATLSLNAADLTIRSAILDTGAVPTFSVDAALERVNFTFAQPLAAGSYALTIAYSGKINETANGLFTAPYKTADGQARTMLVTQFEPGDARRFAPIWDEPGRKAVFTLDVTIPADQFAMSNMPVAEESAASNGTKRVWFEPSPKMSSYLLFLGVGDLERLSGQIGQTQLGIVTKAGDKEKGNYALEATKQILPYYNEYFGTSYPLPKLDQIAVPGAGGFGAMENWGAILYFEPVLLFDPKLSAEADRQRIFTVVGHEVAHQWFGNLVTMSWWDDLWLNEGFASWMETKATNHFRPEWKPWLQSLGGQEGAMGLDARASTHPIVQQVDNLAQANQAFDTITYQKGEAVIRMIEAFVGETGFRDGVRAYMAKHAYDNTVTQDLWTALEAASGTPVKAIAADFTLQSGVPLISLDGARCVAGKTSLALTQGRFGTDAVSRTPRAWRVPVTASVLGNPSLGKAVITGKGSLETEGCGPVILNKDRTGYYRVKYDAASYGALRDNFAKLDPADQLALLYDSWALGTSGDAPIVRYLELAKRTPADADPLVQRQIVGVMERLRGLYAGQPGEAAFNAYALETLKPMLIRIGWNIGTGEAANVSLLRTGLIGALARLGDEETIAEARRRYAASQSDPAAMPPALRGAILGAVGRAADQATWGDLKAKAAAAKSPLEQRQFLGAMAAAKDPALAKQSLEFFLTDAVPKQLAPGLIGGVTGTHPDLGWNFYLARRAEIDARLDPLQKLEYGPGLASAFSDAKKAAELQAFAKANLPADAKKSVDEAVAGILYDAQIRSVRLTSLTRWLQSSNR